MQELVKLIFNGIKALYKLLFPTKVTTPVLAYAEDDQPKIRVQFEDFIIDNFDIAPIWEFALDEAGEDGQDETTLRPCFGLAVADPADGLSVVKSEFLTAAGKKFYGLCTPAFEFRLDEIQPYMFTDNGMLSFWFGMLEPTQQSIDELYKQFNENKDTLFPIKFKSVVPTKGAKLQGQIDDFMWRPIDGETVITIK
ncbi:MAG: hypothetical protein SH856_08580 [Flavobacteriales bacterium]|nr:hypothetical protein [Flavobacteriales bacterium]